MIFDPEGEYLAGIGRGSVAPVEKWANWSFLSVALARAEEAFVKAGALQPIEIANDQIQIMEYHRRRKLVFVIHRKIAGKDRYHVESFDLSPEVIAELTATEKWPVVH